MSHGLGVFSNDGISLVVNALVAFDPGIYWFVMFVVYCSLLRVFLFCKRSLKLSRLMVWKLVFCSVCFLF